MRAAFALASTLACAAAGAVDFSGNVALETRIFPESAQFDEQYDGNTTLSLQPRWSGEWNDGDDRWSVELFARADGKDEERRHADIREALWLHIDGDNEWRVGINTMSWITTESKHLVDVVNQIDQVEGIDGEDKLGQPMLHWKRYQDWGVIDVLLLPGFRERTFAGEEGRLRTPLLVDTEQADYESGDEDSHVDIALRFTQTYADLDLGVSWFRGTSRDPLLQPGRDADGNPVLVPFYEQMTQLGIDGLLIHEDWIWRLEWIRRHADSADFDAWTAGFEYSFYGIAESAVDLGLLVELSVDGRPKAAAHPLDHDVFTGTRFAFNDVQSTEILAGFIVDLDNQGRSLRVEGSRRFGDSFKGTLELQTFSAIDAADPLAAFADDDFLLLELAYYF